MSRFIATCSLCALVGACEPHVPEGSFRSLVDAGVFARFEPAQQRGVSPVSRIRLARLAEPPLPRLFRGKLSSYQLGRASTDELSASLREIHVPAWTGLIGGKPTLVPLQMLETGSHTLVTARRESSEFSVEVPEILPVARVWPAEGIAGGVAVYCAQPTGESPRSFPPGGLSLEVQLLPEGTARLRPLPADDCASLEVQQAPARPSLSPLWLEGFLLQPTVFEPMSTENGGLMNEACSHGLAGACISVGADRLIIDGPDFDTYWVVHEPVRFAQALASGHRLVVPALPPNSEVEVVAEVFDVFGRHFTARLSLRTGDTEARVVINEVMANPLGPEPEQEWVELYNAGTAAAELGGWKLGDLGGSATLPSLSLASGHYALVVPNDFDESLGWAVVPEANTALLRVSRLGTSGLSNSGEALRLLSTSGTVISRFPPVASPQAGVSVARGDPWAPFEASEGFAMHGPPGASPGAPNALSQTSSIE